MMFDPILLLLAAASLSPAAAAPSYKIPAVMLAALAENDGCVLPVGFVIDNFRLCLPAPDSTNGSSVIDFAYSDNSTGIRTPCHYNATSANVAPEGLAPRYACDNSVVEFIWQNRTLTMIEKACPKNNSPRGFEAAGSVNLVLSCGEARRAGRRGQQRTVCTVAQNGGTVAANFTSLEPTPS